MSRALPLSCFALLALLAAAPASAAPAPGSDPGAPLRAEADRLVSVVLPKVVNWRRDIHQHPELGNREFRTSKLVAAHLQALGLEVRTGIAHTGVVGVLKGGKPGPVVALRADMDALPVKEEVDLPFRSEATAQWGGREVGVMHACGHDNHVSMLMGAAEVLAGMKARIPGTVVFLFQPAEEGTPIGEDGGAPMMVAEGALDQPKVDAVFGLHVFPFPTGTLAWRSGGLMASADMMEIRVRGRQTHGAMPWAGVDPIVVGSQIVMALQTIVSREANLTTSPAIVTIGSFQGGNRGNIIPDEVVMSGTLRTFDPKMKEQLREAVRHKVELIAQSGGATASVSFSGSNPVTFNDPALSARMGKTLLRLGGPKANPEATRTTTAEDFSYYQQKVPGLFFFLGVTPEGTDPATAAPNHSPRFFADEKALPIGIQALSHLALDYLSGGR